MDLTGTSEDFKRMNPHVWKSMVGLHQREMNKTESEFSHILERKKNSGEIVRWIYEGMTLRWADMRYTPDFVVVFPNVLGATLPFMLIEVKGGFIRDRDIVRFKGARAFWPEFHFEMHQKTKQGWTRKY